MRLWRTGPGSQLALYPNLNVTDETWRGLVRDVRFRRALSLAVDRHEINQAIYFGLAIEGQNTLLPQSPLYRAAVPLRLGAVRSRRGQPAARSGRPASAAATALRQLPDGRTARDHRREFGRIDRAIGRARTDPRFLAAHRDQALRQTVAADVVPPAGVLRRDDDVDRQRHREWPGNRRHVAVGVRADHSAAARMAEMGPVL